MADPCRILSSERPSADPRPIELRGSRPSRARPRRLRPAPRLEGGLTYRPGLGRAKLARTESASHEISTRIMLATAIVLCCQFRHRSFYRYPHIPTK